MRRTIWLIMLAAALVLVLGSAGFCQENLLKAQDSQQEMQVGSYIQEADGNQDWVREYDGRDFGVLGLEFYDTYGYQGNLQYWLTARDIIVGDEYIVFGFANRNLFRLSGSTNMLTHRLGATPANNPWVAEQLSNLPAQPAPQQGVSWDTFKDLSAGSQYEVGRRVTELNLYANPDSAQRLGLVAGWWQEIEGGDKQLLFRAREAQLGVLDNRDRASVALPVERETNEASFGTDLAVGKNTVVNYRFIGTKFADNRAGIAADSRLDFLPLNSLTRIGSETHSHVLKARTSIGSKLQFTGAHIRRERTNSASDIPSGFANAGSILGKKIKTDSTNLGMVFRATDALSFTGRWRRIETDNLVPPIFAVRDGVEATTASNVSLSRDLTSLEFEGVYTGISRAYLRMGFEKRDIDRKGSSLHPGEEEFAYPFTGASTNWDIWRAAFRYHPTQQFNLSANYENWGGDQGGFVGVPNNRTKMNLNMTYLFTDNFAVYGDFNKWDESNDKISVAGAIPTPATNASEQELREEAAGQGYNSTFKTTSIGTWYSVNDRVTLDANYGLVDMDSSALWVFGTDPANLPHLVPDVVPFKSQDKQWSMGTNYVASRRLRLYGRFFHSDSNGASFVDPAKFTGLGPEWTPVNVKQDRWTLGLAYGLSQKDRVGLDFSLAKWVDEIDSGNTGRYNLWRVNWARQF